MTAVATTDVLVVVDPTAPGAARSHTAHGDVLADLVAIRAVAEGGHPAGRLDAPTLTAAVDVLAAALRGSSSTPLALVDASLVAATTVYGDVVAEPDGLGRVLRDDDRHVLALRVPAGARAALADAVERAAAGWQQQRLLDAVADAAAELQVAGREIAAGAFPARLAATASEAADALRAVQDVDEPALRLRRASRSDDGFLSTFLVRPLSRRLTRVALALGLRPATVTAAALTLGLLAAFAYAGGTRGRLVAGSVLLLCSLVVDCVDGEVARYTRTTSALGGWLDVAADRVKEYAVYGGLAAGAVRVTDADARQTWLLALASLGLLVTRHFVDFGFAARRSAPDDEGAVGVWSARTDRNAVVRYAKRAVIAPVGERTIVLAVLAPLAGVSWTFVVLLALGLVAAAWTTAGRLARTVRSSVRPGPDALRRLRTQVDGAPVPPRAWPVGGRLGWLLPALARAVEQGGATALVAWLVPEALGGLLAWLAVVAIGEYDLTYRGRLTGALDPAPPLAVVGWPARLALVALVAVALPDVAGTVLALAAAVLAVAVLVASGTFWARWVPSTP